MVQLLSLRFVWMVIALGLGGCQASTQEQDHCIPVDWRSIELSEEDIFDYMNEHFAIRRHEIELGAPCAQGEDITVSIRGGGEAVPKHQVWLAIIRHGKIDIAPSE